MDDEGAFMYLFHIEEILLINKLEFVQFDVDKSALLVSYFFFQVKIKAIMFKYP